MDYIYKFVAVSRIINTLISIFVQISIFENVAVYRATFLIFYFTGNAGALNSIFLAACLPAKYINMKTTTFTSKTNCQTQREMQLSFMMF